MASQALAAQCAQLPPRLAPHCLTNDRTSDTYTCTEVSGAIVICNWSRAAANLAYCAFCQPRFLERTLSIVTRYTVPGTTASGRQDNESPGCGRTAHRRA